MASAQPQLIDEVKALELECRKAELLLNLQRTRSAAAALELSTMETEDQVRRNKRSLSDHLEGERREAAPAQDTTHGLQGKGLRK